MSSPKSNGIKNALPGAFGDEFLYKNISIFRKVRNECLKRGFKYKTGRAVENYYNWPLMHLDWILKTKTIPFRRNFFVIQNFAKKFPEVTGVLFGSPLHPERNYAFHESCHVLAHEVEKKRGIISGSNRDESIILGCVFGESCALATELMCGVDFLNQGHDDKVIYYNLNSYFPHQAINMSTVSSLERFLSKNQILGLFIYFYIVENLAVPNFNKFTAEIILDAIGRKRKWSPTAIETCIRAHAMVKNFNPLFINMTNLYYFNFRGVNGNAGEVRDTLAKDPESVVNSLKPYVESYIKLIGVQGPSDLSGV